MDFSKFSDEAFAAYLAGFTDGEGWMGYKPGEGVRIVLANCVVGVLEGMRQRLGYGSIRSQKQREHWSERFVLVFQNADECERFIRLVYPYLHIKRPVADELLARCEEWRACLRSYNDRNRAIREALATGERQKDIAARFGVSPQTVSRIKLGHTWPSERPRNSRGLQGMVKRRHLAPPAPQAPLP